MEPYRARVRAQTLSLSGCVTANKKGESQGTGPEARSQLASQLGKADAPEPHSDLTFPIVAAVAYVDVASDSLLTDAG